MRFERAPAPPTISGPLPLTGVQSTETVRPSGSAIVMLGHELPSRPHVTVDRIAFTYTSIAPPPPYTSARNVWLAPVVPERRLGHVERR